MTLKLLKSIRIPIPGDCKLAFALVGEFLWYARQLDVEDPMDVDLIEDVDYTFTGYLSSFNLGHWTNARSPKEGKLFDESGQSSFLALAIQAKLAAFVDLKLRRKGSGLLREKKGRPLLAYALRPDRIIGVELPDSFRKEQWMVDIPMIRMLLEHGADLNEGVPIYRETNGELQTVWILFLFHCVANRNRQSAAQVRAWYHAFDLLISLGGADLHVCFGIGDQRSAGDGRRLHGKPVRNLGNLHAPNKRREITWWAVAEVIGTVFPESRSRALINLLVESHRDRCRENWGYWIWWGGSLDSLENEQRAAAGRTRPDPSAGLPILALRPHKLRDHLF